MKNLSFLLLLILVYTQNIYARISPYDLNQPVGFATFDNGTTGGESGSSVTVTTYSELSTALKRSGKSIIYVKGSIEFNGRLSVETKDKTILGLPGCELINNNRTRAGSGILYLKNCQNIIIRNITFKSAGAYDVDGEDNICLDNSKNIWIDHCDFQDGVDGNFDCKNASDNIAVTWCRFRYLITPLAGGPGGSDDHRFSNLWGSSDDHTQDRGKLKTTFMFCWWDQGCRERMPRIRFGKVHLLNCLYNSNVSNYCIGGGLEADVYIDKSAFIGVSNPYRNITEPHEVRFNDCYFRNVRGDYTGTGSSFIPEYTLEGVPAENVYEIVTHKTVGAGATLNIEEGVGVITDGEIVEPTDPENKESKVWDIQELPQGWVNATTVEKAGTYPYTEGISIIVATDNKVQINTEQTFTADSDPETTFGALKTGGAGSGFLIPALEEGDEINVWAAPGGDTEITDRGVKFTTPAGSQTFNFTDTSAANKAEVFSFQTNYPGDVTVLSVKSTNFYRLEVKSSTYVPTNIGTIDPTVQNSYNAPNPFTDITVIKYVLEENSPVKFTILDIKGNVLYQLNQNQSAGENEIVFNGSHLSSGIYFYTLQTGNRVESRKIIKK